MIKSYIKDDQRDWNKYLCCLAAAYRAAQHETTGFSPNQLMLGREIRLPGGVAPPVMTENLSEATYVDTLRGKLLLAHETVRKHLKAKILKQKEYCDSRSFENKYNPGDMVWYLNETTMEGISPKLQPTYIGPCLILKKYVTMDYLIQKDRSRKKVVVHHDKLKPYEGVSQPKWATKAYRDWCKCS